MIFNFSGTRSRKIKKGMGYRCVLSLISTLGNLLPDKRFEFDTLVQFGTPGRGTPLWVPPIFIAIGQNLVG